MTTDTQNRLLNTDRAVRVMNEIGIDALIATTPENVTYSSNFWALGQWLRRGPQVYVALSRQALDDNSWLVVGTGSLDLLATQEVWVENVARYGFFSLKGSVPSEGLGGGQAEAEQKRLSRLLDAPYTDGPAQALAHALEKMGLAAGRLGIDEFGILPSVLDELRELLPQSEIVPASEAFRKIRAVKTPAEIERLTKAAQSTERAIEATFAVAQPGVTERELSKVFLRELVDAGADPALTVLGCGVRSALPNATPSDYGLSIGDIIRFDAGCYYDHYRADISRCAVLGEPTAKHTRVYDAILAGQDAALAAIRPGASAREVYQAAMAAARSTGLPEYERNHVGHGIGVEGYDIPNLTAQNDTILEAGMTMCIETPYYEIGWGGLQVEDTVVVTDTYETLMATGRHLRVLDV
ncbi:Xaa-Pro peptidase family protein [Streptomyces violaceusniger]|uniref:M24 family metallopeptidase n=1 Tax=Streptomyces violaceusniger TaxID=68280 RepID=UPI0009971C18|nr:Xaa-Pro peptidase family protein [Streptomyces hygroscopicus]AQW46603.1 peptidase M24 [Streptomyces hygroscopicus]